MRVLLAQWALKLNNRKNFPYLTRLIAKLAPQIGASFVVEPKWGYVGQIIYKSKKVRSLRLYSLDLNSIASSDIAKDKGYSKFFIKKIGYKVPRGITLLKDEWARLIKEKNNKNTLKNFIRKNKFPLIVKPNSKSQGVDVFLVWNKLELKQALRKIFKEEKISQVEEYLKGKDYRVVVLDNEIISAYERIPLSIIGDGNKTISELLNQKQKSFLKTGRDTKINLKDKRILNNLKKFKLNFKSVLSKGKKIFLLDNANLSSGGESIDVTSSINLGFKRIAVDVTKRMGLRFSGVDLIVTRGDITKNPESCDFYILEINSAPGLDHYASTGKKQQKIVEEMYLKILKALAK